MSPSEKLKKEEALQNIHNNAKTLFEAFSTQLTKGTIPEGLTLPELSYWGSQIRTKHFNLKDRINLFKSSKHSLNTQNSNWIQSFSSILDLYNSNLLAYAQYSNTTTDQPFYEVILPFLEFAQNSITRKYPRLSDHLKESALQSCMDHLSMSLVNICANALASDYKIRKKTSYKKYCSSFYNGYSFTFFEEHSALARVLTLQTLNWVYSLKTFIQHLKTDLPKLSKLFFNGTKVNKVLSIMHDEGPAHSPLGPNRVIIFANNQKIIYKTKSAQNDIFYNRLITWLNGNQEDFHFDTYCVYDRKIYSWHEFIPHKKCKNRKEVKAYYIRLGYLSALLQMLGSTDYHYGNIISNGPQPMLIDHETILNLNDRKRSFDIKKANILDSKSPNYNLLGAFHNEVSQTLTSTKITKKGKVKMYDKKHYWLGKNLPTIRGSQVNPIEFTNQIAAGHALGVSLLVKQQKSFISFIRKQLNSLELNHRYLHRPSIDYLLLLFRSFDPSYLRSGISRSIFFESLFQKVENEKPDLFSLYIISKEIISVENQFWPRFILSNDEEEKLRKDQKRKYITRNNYLKNQIIENFKHLKKNYNLKKEVKAVSKHLNSISKI